MQIYKIYDNGGKTIDRYTILTEPWYFGKSCDCLCVDDQGGQVFSQWSSCFAGKHLGKEITFDDLPEATQDHVLKRLAEDEKS